MPSVESVLTRIAEVEAEKQLLRSQLSSLRRKRCLGQSGKVAPSSQISTAQPADTVDKVTGWLNTPTQKPVQSPLLTFLTDHERHVGVFDNIYRLLEIKDIITISRTCKSLSSFYQNMLPCRWNINRRLARFVNDPKESRSQLGQADALISGTFALLFFAQLYWMDSGLDIYVRQGSKADALIRYIGEDKAYEFDYSYGWSDNDEHRTLTKVLIFCRKGPPSSPQIRFHLTRTLPLHSILTDCAFSTAHVNFITWNKAYCMFPRVTFIDRRMYFLHNPDEALGQILSKYSAHGWRSSDWVDYDQTKGCGRSGIRQNIRKVGDSSTWIIPLNLHKVRPSTTQDSILESCSFQVFPDSGPNGSSHSAVGLKTFSIGAQVFSCCMLKHSYTFHTPDTSWHRFLRDKLSRMIMLEILKTGDADLIARSRKSDFILVDHKLCPLLRAIPRFRRPEGWEHVDHMIPAWYKEWQSLYQGATDGTILTPHPLNVVRSRKHIKDPLPAVDLTSSPPPLPPRVRSMTNRPTPKILPTPPPSSKSEYFPVSTRRPRSPVPRPPRSSSISNFHSTKATRTSSVPPNKCEHTSQLHTSKSEVSLSQHASQIPKLRSVRSHRPQISDPPCPQKADYFSLRHRRPKAPVPLPLRLDLPTQNIKDWPLTTDVVTPPPDMPLPALPVLNKTPVWLPPQLQHLPLSPFGKKYRAHKSPGSQSSASLASERMAVPEGEWI